MVEIWIMNEIWTVKKLIIVNVIWIIYEQSLSTMSMTGEFKLSNPSADELLNITIQPSIS